VKYYAWEVPFQQNITASREAELVQLKSSTSVRAQMIVLLQNTPSLGIALTFVFYGINSALDYSSVFTSIALLNLLRAPFILLPIMLAFGMQYKYLLPLPPLVRILKLQIPRATFERIQNFLTQPELQRRPKEDDTSIGPSNGKYAIVMEDATFTYFPEDKSAPPVLQNVNLKIKRGELAMVIGIVGSGKSVRFVF